MDPVLKHLGRHVTLTEAARAEFGSFVCSIAQRLDAGREIVRPDQRGRSLVLVDGWVVREMTLPDGRRQVTALFLPGDIFDFNAELMAECGYSVRTITKSTIAELSRQDFQRLTANNRDLDQALTWQQLEQVAIQSEWLVNLGQRSAPERLAHFFCEVFWRLRAVGLTQGDECAMPLTQIMLSDVTGMTPVHVNRSLKYLRDNGMIELRRGHLRLLNGQALADVALFDSSYLDLGDA